MQSPQTRRAILHSLAALGVMGALPRSGLAVNLFGDAAGTSGSGKESGALALARCAERWLAQSRIPTAHGVTWPAEPDNAGESSTDLYGGTAGIVLFYMELYAATGESRYLREAMAGADDIAAHNARTPREPGNCGLYTGLAGHIFLFAELGKLPGAERYTRLAKEYVARMRNLARPAGTGVDWNDYTDIVYGNAGIGLALLGAHQAFGDAEALSVARQAGLRLLEIGIPADGGLRWEMKPGYPRYMPNFSHGTAGVAYFLATLHQATGEQRFLDGALAGAKHVLAVADTDNGLCNIMHDDPEGRHLYFYGWCHGPVGTTRLFYRLGQITKDPVWDSWVERGARTLIESGIPQRRSEGYWNNVGACCGDAAVLQFFLDLYNAYGEGRYLQFARRMLAEVQRRCEKDGEACKWVHAEMRLEPENLMAQTGFMQGAAGIGTVLLRADGTERARKHIVFPDSPFPAV